MTEHTRLTEEQLQVIEATAKAVMFKLAGSCSVGVNEIALLQGDIPALIFEVRTLRRALELALEQVAASDCNACEIGPVPDCSINCERLHVNHWLAQAAQEQKEGEGGQADGRD